MQGNDIGDDGISSVADGLQHNKSLTKLNVSKCGVSVKGNYHNIIVYNYRNNLLALVPA